LQMLVRIATRAEEHTTRIHPDFSVSHQEWYRTAKKYSIRSAHFMADEVWAVGIVLFTKSGHFARLASAYQPNVPLFAFSPSQETVKHLSLMYGVKPFLMAEWEYESDEAFKQHEKSAIALLLSQWKVSVWDVLVIAYDGHRGGQRIAQVKIVHVGGTVD
jgi:pyruvate kinase